MRADEDQEVKSSPENETQELQNENYIDDLEKEFRTVDAEYHPVRLATHSDENVLRRAISKATLTAGQVALLYKTLQCDAESRKFTTSEYKFVESTNHLKFRSENLIVKPSTSFTTGGNKILGMLSALGNEELFGASSVEMLKQRFWDEKATLIQAVWRSYIIRKILRVVLFDGEIFEDRATECDVENFIIQNYSANDTEEGFPDPIPIIQSPPDISENVPSNIELQDAIIENRFAAANSVVEDIEETIGKTEREALVILFNILKGGSKRPTLTLQSLVSALRQCRTGIQKSSFDKLLDKAITALLKSRESKFLSGNDFIAIVEKSDSSDTLLEISYKLQRDVCTATRAHAPTTNLTLAEQNLVKRYLN